MHSSHFFVQIRNLQALPIKDKPYFLAFFFGFLGPAFSLQLLQAPTKAATGQVDATGKAVSRYSFIYIDEWALASAQGFSQGGPGAASPGNL